MTTLGTGPAGGQRLALGALFVAHAACSVNMILLNKTLALKFDYPWMVLLLQNVLTVVLGFAWPYLAGEKPLKPRLHQCKRSVLQALGFCLPTTDEDDGHAKGGGDGRGMGLGSSTAAEQDDGVHRILGLRVPQTRLCRMLTLLQALFFMLTLFMSLKALRFVSIPLYVVARNMVPAATAALERLLSGTPVSRTAALGLSGTVLGAIVYTKGDMARASSSDSALGSDAAGGGISAEDAAGLVYAAALVVIVALCSVVDKTAVRTICDREGLTINETNQNRIAVSMPLNLLFVLAFELHKENVALGGVGAVDVAIGSVTTTTAAATAATAAGPPPLVAALFGLSASQLGTLVLSGALGFGVGTFNFYLQQASSATAVQVANIGYKLATTLLSRLTHPAPVAAASWLGFVLSLVGIALYSFAAAGAGAQRGRDPRGLLHARPRHERQLEEAGVALGHKQSREESTEEELSKMMETDGHTHHFERHPHQTKTTISQGP